MSGKSMISHEKNFIQEKVHHSIEKSSSTRKSLRVTKNDESKTVTSEAEVKSENNEANDLRMHLLRLREQKVELRLKELEEESIATELKLRELEKRKKRYCKYDA